MSKWSAETNEWYLDLMMKKIEFLKEDVERLRNMGPDDRNHVEDCMINIRGRMNRMSSVFDKVVRSCEHDMTICEMRKEVKEEEGE